MNFYTIILFDRERNILKRYIYYYQINNLSHVTDNNIFDYYKFINIKYFYFWFLHTIILCVKNFSRRRFLLYTYYLFIKVIHSSIISIINVIFLSSGNVILSLLPSSLYSFNLSNIIVSVVTNKCSSLHCL
jgi:hypothetical protein